MKFLYDVGVKEARHFYKNFTENRAFQVQIANKKSQGYIQETRVRHWSVLNIILFILAVNYVIKDIPPGVQWHTSLYVDDLVKYYSATNSIRHIVRRLQSSINKICTWAAATATDSC